MITLILVILGSGLVLAGGIVFILDDSDDDNIFYGLFCIVVALCIIFLPLVGQYTMNLTLIHRLPAIERTIEEQTALIASGDIGSGLEGMQMKSRIQDLYYEKNKIIATYEVRQVSPWWIFRPQWIKEE